MRNRLPFKVYYHCTTERNFQPRIELGSLAPKALRCCKKPSPRYGFKIVTFKYLEPDKRTIVGSRN